MELKIAIAKAFQRNSCLFDKMSRKNSDLFWRNHIESRKFTAQKMKFSIKDFFSKCDQIHRKLRIWSHLLKKSLIENFSFCAVVICRCHFTYHESSWREKKSKIIRFSVIRELLNRKSIDRNMLNNSK